jgi:hypothetical protein
MNIISVCRYVHRGVTSSDFPSPLIPFGKYLRELMRMGEGTQKEAKILSRLRYSSYIPFRDMQGDPGGKAALRDFNIGARKHNKNQLLRVKGEASEGLKDLENKEKLFEGVIGRESSADVVSAHPSAASRLGVNLREGMCHRIYGYRKEGPTKRAALQNPSGNPVKKHTGRSKIPNSGSHEIEALDYPAKASREASSLQDTEKPIPEQTGKGGLEVEKRQNSLRRLESEDSAPRIKIHNILDQLPLKSEAPLSLVKNLPKRGLNNMIMGRGNDFGVGIPHAQGPRVSRVPDHLVPIPLQSTFGGEGANIFVK